MASMSSGLIPVTILDSVWLQGLFWPRSGPARFTRAMAWRPSGDARGSARCDAMTSIPLVERLFVTGRQRVPFKPRQLGAVPRSRTGLHGGTVVASEVGDDKHEIVYFGDTINTAPRLQDPCKSHQRSYLVSGELLMCARPPPVPPAACLHADRRATGGLYPCVRAWPGRSFFALLPAFLHRATDFLEAATLFTPLLELTLTRLEIHLRVQTERERSRSKPLTLIEIKAPLTSLRYA